MTIPKNKLITLVDVAFSAKGAEEIYGMKIGDHKLICSVLDAHLDVVEENNSAFHEKLIADVIEVVKNELRPMNESLSDIKLDIAHMKCDVIGIRQQIKIIKDENEKVHGELKEQIECLKDSFYPVKEKASWRAIIIRGIIIALAAIILTLLILYFTLPWYHSHYLAQLFSSW